MSVKRPTQTEIKKVARECIENPRKPPFNMIPFENSAYLIPRAQEAIASDDLPYAIFLLSLELHKRGGVN